MTDKTIGRKIMSETGFVILFLANNKISDNKIYFKGSKAMKFEEALKAMREGKKVKRKFTPILWLENGEIWYKCKHGTFNYPLTTGEILSEDWEVVDD